MNSFKITGILAFLLVSFFASVSTGFARYSYGDAMSNTTQATSTYQDSTYAYSNTSQNTYVDTSSTYVAPVATSYSDSSYVYATSSSSSYQDTSTYSYQDSSSRYGYRKRNPPPPPPPPVNGVCSSSVTGPQSYPLTTGACDSGYAVGFNAKGLNTIYYSWVCIGSNRGYSSQTCRASYTPPVQPPPPPPPPVNGVCSSSVTGPQSYPLTSGACDSGNVVGFTADGSNTIEYSWVCSGSNGGYSSQTCRASYTPPVTPPPRSGGVVSLSFDDGWMSQYQNALPILDSAGIKGTFGIIAGYMQEADYTKSTHDYYMNTDEVKIVAGRGHEIASHTFSHADLSLLDTLGLTKEVIDSRTILQNSGLGIIDTLIYPYGVHTPTIDEFVKNAGYARARTVDNGYNTLSTDQYSLMTQSVNVDTPLSQVQAWIDYAQTNNVWLVLVFHQIDTSGSIYSSTPDTLQGIVNYIQKTGIESLPIREALGKL